MPNNHALHFLVVVLMAGVLGLGLITGSVALMAKSCFHLRSKREK